MKSVIYNQKGEKAGEINLPKKIFDLPWNAEMVHQTIVSMQSNARQGSAHVKDRSDVSGGGKKPWRQKGTGRARAGSIRSPIWRGGGVTFGPVNEKDYKRKINKKVKTKTLYTILSAKNRDNEILFVDDLKFGAPKTKEAKTFLDVLSKASGNEEISSRRRNRAVVCTLKKDDVLGKSFANFSNIKTTQASVLDPLTLMQYKYVIIVSPKKSVEVLKNRGNN
jgi:large subunit ribosomal protein L4